ncbi:MAG TPA: glycosyltransferase family 4 protein, partial [Vicinamibacterales bacterium]|nr:glycosyltransferase family 4 protein [Vicinamibacterales bacterium]
PNSLLIGLAAPLRHALKRPVCCTLQGEDLFLDGLVEPYRTRATGLIRRQVGDVDMFLPVSDGYVQTMSERLHIPLDRMSTVPLGINLAGYKRRAAASDSDFRVGYFARLAPEKGLHVLAEAYARLRARTPDARMRLEAAGYLAPAQGPYLEGVRRQLDAAGLGGEFTYHGTVNRDGKLAFLESLDVFSVPATYDEPKGVFLLEAMAAGVPVVQPRRGAFTEIVEKTGGGLLVRPDDSRALADGLHSLWQDAALRDRIGRQGFEGVREHYNVQRSTDRLLTVYEGVIARSRSQLPSA